MKTKSTNILSNSVIMITAMIAILLLLIGPAAAFSGQGSGTTADPYQITSFTELNEVRNDLNANYILMNDIAIADSVSADRSLAINYWTPIGTSSMPFRGTFDGQNNTLTRLICNDTYVGLFGYTQNATISNLKLYNSTLYPGVSGGILAAFINNTTVINCKVEDLRFENIGGTDVTGGLIGTATSNSKIQECHVNLNLTAYGTNGGFGCIVGKIEDGTIINSTASRLSGNGYYYKGSNISVGGGIAAFSNNTVIENSSFNGHLAVESNATTMGGIVGIMNGGSILNSYSEGFIKARYTQSNPCGGLVGKMTGGTITSSYAACQMINLTVKGGLVGTNSGGSITNSYYDSEVSGCSDTGKGTPKTTAQMKNISTYSGWNIQNIENFQNLIWKINTGCHYPKLNGQLIQVNNSTFSFIGDGEIHIDAAGNSRRWDTYSSYVLTEDIEADSNMFQSLGDQKAPFRNYFDGRNFTIRNLTINSEDNSSGGTAFIGRTVKATVINVFLDGLTIVGNSPGGGMMTSADATLVRNCGINNGKIITNGSVGGLIGTIRTGSLVEDCYAFVTIEPNNGTPPANAGGFSNMISDSTIKNCFARGDVTGNATGGFVAVVNNSTINDCYATGNVNGKYAIGGFVSELKTSTIENCYANGNATKRPSNTSLDVNSLIAVGTGGFAGEINSSKIRNSYSTGLPVSSSEIGGFIGNAEVNVQGVPNTITNCFYDSQTSGQNDNDGNGTPKTTAEMKSFSTFSNVGWNIKRSGETGDKNWEIRDTLDYPRLTSVEYTELKDIAVNNSTFGFIGDGQARNDAYGNSRVWAMDAEYTLTENVTVTAAHNFVPIGTQANPFTGTFDGQKYKISDLAYTSAASDNIGLFGFTDGAKISNSVLENVTFNGRNNVGALIGSAANTTVSNNSIMSGSVTVSGNNAGGLIGNLNSGTVENNYALEAVTAAGTNAGGLIGNMAGGTIDKSFAGGLISSTVKGGIVGTKTSGTVTNSFYDSETTGCNDNTGKGTPKTHAEMFKIATFSAAGWNIRLADGSGNNLWQIHEDRSYPHFNWQTVDPVILKDIAVNNATFGFIGDGQTRNDAYGNSRIWTMDAEYTLTEDVTVTAAHNFAPIGTQTTPFTGTFDGQKYKISNLTYTNAASDNIGLFGFTDGAKISNSVLENVIFNGRNNVGALAGAATNTTVSNNSIMNGSVTASGNNAGGLIGILNSGIVENSYALEAVTATGTNAGGLIGNMAGGTIDKSFAGGLISSTVKGGLVGSGTSGVVTNSFYDSETTGCNDNTGKGTPKTHTEMFKMATFSAAGWDIRLADGSGNNLWQIHEDRSYPHFNWQTVDPVILKDIAVNNSTFGFIGDGQTRNDANGNSRIWTMDAEYTLIENVMMTAAHNFTPIGTAANPFNGTFDGQKHKIENLAYSNSGTDNAGLFGYTDGAEISNIVLENANIAGKDNVGTLIGTANNTTVLRNTVMNGAVTAANNNAGGLIGELKSGTVENSYALNAVTATGNNTGGLIGTVSGGTVFNTFAGGNVAGNIKGGLIGSLSGGTVTGSFYDLMTTGCNDNTGKGVPKMHTEMFSLNTFSDAGWNIRPADDQGDTIWKIHDGGSYPHFDWQTVTPTPPITNISVNESTFGYIGDGLEHIDADGNTAIWSLSANYTLTENVSITTAHNFTPIGTQTNPFTGTFDGAEYTIFNLSYSNAGADHTGLFGYTDGAVISNIILENVTLAGQNNIGALIGSANNTTVEKSAVMNGTITGSGNNVGGFVGYLMSGDINNSYALNTVSGYVYAGGLVGGMSGGAVTDSFAAGPVSASAEIMREELDEELRAGLKGGLIGARLNGIVADSFYDSETTGCDDDIGKGVPKTHAEMYAFDTFSFAGWDIKIVGAPAQTVWMIHDGSSYPHFNWQNIETNPVPGTIEVNNTTFGFIGTDVIERDAGGVLRQWSLDTDYVLTEDVHVSAGHNFVPIGTETDPFAGTFDGQGYTVFDLLYEDDTADNVGLFGYTDGAVISNTALGNVTLNGSSNVGGLIGTAENTNVNMVAVKDDSTITGVENIGGLIGKYESGILFDSYSLGEVTAVNDYAGGLTGKLVDAEMYNSFAAGLISSGNEKGGIVGINENGFIDVCFYDSETTSCPDTGDGTPMTTLEMYDFDTFWNDGWDISESGSSDDTIWKIENGINYPYLNW